MDVKNILLPEEFAQIINDAHERFCESFDYWSDRNAENW